MIPSETLQELRTAVDVLEAHGLPKAARWVKLWVEFQEQLDLMVGNMIKACEEAALVLSSQQFNMGMPKPKLIWEDMELEPNIAGVYKKRNES